MHRTGKGLRRGVGAAAGLALLVLTLTVAACGSSGPATRSAAPSGSSGPATPSAAPSGSAGSAGAYLNCLLQHGRGIPGSARQACTSLRPANLAAELLTFETCLKAHGVTVPSLPSRGRRAALLQLVAGLSTGSTAQRSALRSCIPSRIPG